MRDRSVSLQPMSAAAAEGYLDRLAREFAAEHVAAGNWAPEGAEARARASTAALLPDGVATAGHELLDIVDADEGHRVGVLWLGPSDGHPSDLFIFDLEIDESQRRRGYARAALAGAEARAMQRGATRLALHVFAANEGARRLYRSVGFEEVDIVMAKPVPRPAGASATAEGGSGGR